MTWDCWNLWEVIIDEETPIDIRDKAVEDFEELADGGDMDAQYLLGKLYRDGGLLIPDSEKARYWLTRSAKNEHTAAQYALGKLLLDDAEVYAPKEAIHWLTLAAERQNSYAAYRLAKEYFSGNHVERSTEKALPFLRDAAEAGNPFAQYTLGKLYLLGQDVPRDIDQVRFWLEQAAQAENHYAETLLERLNHPHPDAAGAVLAVTRVLHHLGRIFQDNLPSSSVPGGMVDRKLLEKMRERRIALGHRLDDHEDPEMNHVNMTM